MILRLLVVVGVLMLASGCDMIVRPETDTSGIGLSAWAIAGTMAENSGPSPAPSPNDKCENCGGTGKVGDGRIEVKCRVCDGTGKKKTKEISATPPDVGSPPSPPSPTPKVPEKPQIPEPTAKRYVLMYSRPDCVNCDKWMVTEADKWRRQGYTVLTRPETAERPVPWFRVVDEEFDQAFLAGLTWGGYLKYREVKKEKKP